MPFKFQCYSNGIQLHHLGHMWFIFEINSCWKQIFITAYVINCQCLHLRYFWRCILKRVPHHSRIWPKIAPHTECSVHSRILRQLHGHRIPNKSLINSGQCTIECSGVFASSVGHALLIYGMYIGTEFNLMPASGPSAEHESGCFLSVFSTLYTWILNGLRLPGTS